MQMRVRLIIKARQEQMRMQKVRKQSQNIQSHKLETESSMDSPS